MIRYSTVVAFWTLLCIGLVGSLSPPAKAQETSQVLSPTFTTPDWGDFPMLMSQFGELCTMCEAYVQCSLSEADASNSGPFNLYYFQTKTFWGQIATIWDYFAKWFDPVTSENRPATIYRFNAAANENISIPTTTYLSKLDARIDIDGTWINRDTAQWNDEKGEKIGSCTRLGIPESMSLIANQGQWTEQQQTDAQQ